MRQQHTGILDADLVHAQIQRTFRKASLLKRCLNLVIDYLAIFHLFTFIGILIGGIFVFFEKQEWVMIFEYEAVNLGLSGVIVFLYYFLCEVFFNGKTLGKFATQTSVKNISGHFPQTREIIIRSFLRLIPFEAVTIFFGKKLSWHDEFSATMVVEDSDE